MPGVSKVCCRPPSRSMELQVARRHAEIANLDDDLQKYLVLSDMQARNETLFYAVLMSDPATYMPLVYTPTVGEACQKFAPYLPLGARHVSADQRARSGEGAAWQLAGTGRALHRRHRRRAHPRSRRSRRRRHGHPLGKLALYTACAGVPPQYCLPVVLDVGTNNQVLLDDPLYLGPAPASRPRRRISWRSSTSSLRRCRQLYPKCCIQWEDFANVNAVPILARYRDKICTFNDDIQGTAGIALAGIFAALRITGQKLAEQRFLFLGARLRREPASPN